MRMKDTVANHLVRYLEGRGVHHVFGLCGHTNIAVLSAMAGSGIQFINVRHEQIAAHAADGYARVTRQASVVLTHLGPGLTNAATGVANAALDCIPMVVIAGDVPSHYFGKHPHQEVNLHADGAQWEIYRPFVKRAWRVDDPRLFPEIIDKAFRLAESGQPGPVLVDVPMDVFSAEVPGELFQRLETNTRSLRKPSLDAATAREIVARLAKARTPVIYVGGGVVLADACEELRALVDHLGIPVAHSLMGKGALPDDHPLVLGMSGFWGTKLVNDACLEADWVPRARHAIQGGRLQFLVSRLHVQYSAHQAHPHRHRSGRDRSQLPHRDRCGGGPQAGARRAVAGGSRGKLHRTRVAQYRRAHCFFPR
jgi:acetolactate synthase-1/2/3 large subunit